MIVTDKQYHLEKKYIAKLEAMIKRMTKQNFDNLVIIFGDEGYGKTTLAALSAYFVHYETKRPFHNPNVFFDLEKMINFAMATEEQIIIWDEAALGGLSTEGYNKIQIKLIKLLMTARKKRHFWIFNIPRIQRLKEDIILRAIAAVRVYALKETSLGRFEYFNKRSKDALYFKWKSSRKMLYRKFRTFRGTFPDKLELVIDIDAYDKEKDLAIMSIGETKSKMEIKQEEELQRIKCAVAKLPVEARKKIAETLGIHPRSVKRWENYQETLENPKNDARQETINSISV